MERTQLFDLMGELKLYGMKAAFDEIMATAVKRQHEPQRIVGDLLNAEISEKQARSIKYQLTIAKLPLAKDLDDFQFEGTPINETLVNDLAGGGFIAQQRNAVLVGGTGTGKTHLAIAIARSCIRSGTRGRFYNVVDLVNRLETETRSGRQGRLADHLTRMDLIILDELGWLGRWAMNLMLINVSTRKLRRAVRLPEGDLPVIAGDGTSKSAASRRFVALSAERLAEWMASDLSKLDLLVIQIDGLHIGNDLVLVAALGIDGEGHKHPPALIEGATENAAVVQALIDNLIERGLDPKVCRLFIIDGAKALSKVIRRTFGAHTPIQRCQIHKARNVIERLPMPLHASARRALRQAWELDDAAKAERLLRNLARRLDQEAPGVAASILEGLDEMLTVNRLGLPIKLRRSLACTNSIENMMGTVRRVCRNVKRWRNAAMALRWTAAGMMEAAKGFRRLKAYKHLPVLRAALAAHQSKYVTQRVEHDAHAA